jgi:mannitol operon repressor
MMDERTKFLADNPHLSEFLPYLDDLSNERPRGRVLISAGYIEELLKGVLLAFMQEVEETERLLDSGALRTFSARASACYALGLISEDEFRVLGLIGKIRNDFAHKPKATFRDAAIADRCRELKNRVPGKGMPERYFSSAAVALISGLIKRAQYVRQERRTYLNWPR